ncbi:GntR family transcriptional regulator [Arthrobacter sp. AZCC_0090]|uniref:GntR family transcriptional regulator n=1 Tax=Arthrobacter sp. AZCC_0090 TaxID=2735881 RepID=UPI00160EEA50|nr:GntR family transcriptional regulator [Arthrobacter sp. AZCC_0090]MBB6407174.1 DNA-binding GntR family transcriptional regulator [Arthrobacter sp. AZCC_0090]
MVRRGSANSLSEDVYQRIRNALFDGSIHPGDRLQPAVLSKEYNASTTVVREALAVLAGERLITSRAGQGYYVPEIEPDLLRDITVVRCHTESLAIRWAMERGGIEWESRVIAAHHRLTRAPRRLPDGHPNPEWSRLHTAFHTEVIAGSGIPVLIDMCEQLSSATEIYRVWSARFTDWSGRDVEGEHAGILEAVLEGDADLTIARLTAHYEATANLIIDNWPADEVAAS